MLDEAKDLGAVYITGPKDVEHEDSNRQLCIKQANHANAKVVVTTFNEELTWVIQKVKKREGVHHFKSAD